MCVSKLCVSKLCVSKLCVRRRRRERERGREADGMQNQKQEPHTKMWGSTTWHSSLSRAFSQPSRRRVFFSKKSSAQLRCRHARP